MAAITAGLVVAGAGAAYSARQARNASRATTAASDRAIAAGQDSEARALDMQRPMYEAGYAATAAMMDMTGLDRSRARGGFDRGAYLRENPDVARDPWASQNPEEHYERHGRAEGRSMGQSPSDLSSYDRYNWRTDPGYQFRLNEGMRALERSSAARGILQSGGTIRSATRYAQNYASNEYQRVYDRIAGIAGRGQSAANTGSDIIIGTGANTGRALMNAGDARASGYIAQGNAWSNAVNQGSMMAGYGGMFGKIGS